MGAARTGRAAAVGALVAAAALSVLLAGQPSLAQAPVPAHHVVRPGETLASIARQYRLAAGDLADRNGLPSSSRVHPDAVLRLTSPARALPAFRASATPVTAARLGASYRPGCPVPPSALRSVRLTHYTFELTAGTGELVVHASVVGRTVAAFRQLYERRFPVQRVVPVSAYGGSDDRSMAANNTSAFNCRRSTGSAARWSEHAYGRAVDVNPVQNPYVRGATVLPSAGRAFADRRSYRGGMVHAAGAAAVFGSQGFSWGGRWRSAQDHQHFSTTGR